MAGKQKIPAEKKSEDLNINKAEDWAKIQGQWAKEKVDVLQARADTFFTTDEELPLSRHILLMAIFLFFITFIVWANFATLDEVTRGMGKVIPSREVQVIQHQEGGIVEEFMVSENDAVEAGQVLMRLSDVGASSDLGVNRQKYLGLKAKAERLEAEAQGMDSPAFSDEVKQEVPASVQEEIKAFRANQANLTSQRSVLDQQLSQKEQEVRELNTRISDLREVIRLARDEKEMIEPLVERGSAPKLELIQLERSLKEKQSELNSATSSLPRANSAVKEVQARLSELTSAAQAQAQEELSATQIEMNSLKETFSALRDRQKRTEIRSPVSGTVKDIRINTVGGVIRPGDEVMEIVPRDDQLLVEVQIRPSDIAFLRPALPAVVKITAYDFSIYGGLKGELVDISPDAITNSEGESFYRVRVRTPETSIKRKGEVLPIIPGMVASVDILTGKKTVMEYLLKPFIKTLDEAMHER